MSAVTEQQEQSGKAESPEIARARATARKFVEAHGKPTKAVIQGLGRMGSRIVLVAPDGHMGDVIVPGPAAGEALVAAEEDLELADWDAETVNQTVIGSRHRRRMGMSLTRR